MCYYLVCVMCVRNFLNVKFCFGNGLKILVYDYKCCGIVIVVGSV